MLLPFVADNTELQTEILFEAQKLCDDGHVISLHVLCLPCHMQDFTKARGTMKALVFTLPSTTSNL